MNTGVHNSFQKKNDARPKGTVLHSTTFFFSTNDEILQLFSGKVSQKHDRKRHPEGRQTAQSHKHPHMKSWLFRGQASFSLTAIIQD